MILLPQKKRKPPILSAAVLTANKSERGEEGLFGRRRAVHKLQLLVSLPFELFTESFRSALPSHREQRRPLFRRATEIKTKKQNEKRDGGEKKPL